MTLGPRIHVAICRICREGISALENDETWMHNLGGFRAKEAHQPEPAEGSIRPLYAYPGMANDNAEPG